MSMCPGLHVLRFLSTVKTESEADDKNFLGGFLETLPRGCWLELICRGFMAQGAAGVGAGVFGAVENQLAVDEDVFDAVVVMERVFVGGLIDHALGIEDGNVGKLTF